MKLTARRRQLNHRQAISPAGGVWCVWEGSAARRAELQHGVIADFQRKVAAV